MEKTLFETAISVKLHNDIVQDLDKFAKKLKMNRSNLIRNILASGLQDLKVMHSTGFLTIALKGYDIFDVIRQSLKDNKYRVEGEQLIIDL